MGTKTTVAVVDVGAHHAIRTLVEGPIVDPSSLVLVEEVLRALVLHDEAILEPLLFPAGSLVSFEQSNVKLVVDRTRNVVKFPAKACCPPRPLAITGTTPAELYELFRTRESDDPVQDIELSPRLLKLTEAHSRAKAGNPVYQAHLDSLKVIFGNVRKGGSVVCETPFFRDAIETAAVFPNRLFEKLDADWKDFATKVNRTGPLVPPVLSIVLSRSASRDKIPAIIRDLRDEWATARSKVWKLLDDLRMAPTLAQAKQLASQLEETSKYFSPFSSEASSRPVQILWEIIVGGMGGALIAAISGGSLGVGGVTGAAGRAIGSVQKDVNFGRILFGTGAFDLARRVRREISRSELDILCKFLSESENRRLGM